MNLIKKPSELVVRKEQSILIYGQPGTGKTTLGVSADNPVLFDFDGGIGRINGAHIVPTLQPKGWEEINEALKEVEESGEYHTIVIDTVGKMLDYMTAYIIKDDSRLAQRDGSLSLKGYGVRKKMFVDFLHRLQVMGMNVVFIAHEREERRGDDIVKRPEIGGSSANDLIKELDLVGYLQMLGKQRVISFTPTEFYYAKNTCNLPEQMKIPVLYDNKGGYRENNFLAQISEQYEETQLEKASLRLEYEELCADLRERVASVQTKDELNRAMTTLAKEKVIYDSKLVLWRALQAKGEELGLTYDRIQKSYV